MNSGRSLAARRTNAGAGSPCAAEPVRLSRLLSEDRSEVTRRLLRSRIPPACQRGTVYTDFWDAYQKVVPDAQHQAVGKESGQANQIER